MSRVTARDMFGTRKGMTMTIVNLARLVGSIAVGIGAAGLVQAQATLGIAPSAASLGSAASATARRAAKPTIVLVHGAFADAAGWERVIPLLQRDGYRVIAVENPLTSLAADVETTKRVIDAETGPVVVVGHSYGGAVMTGAAAGNSNVKALVYIAAFGPEAGEAIGAFGEKYPSSLDHALKPDAAGFLYVDPARFHEVFANDVPAVDAAVMAASQKPISGSAFGASVPEAAWKTIPSWFMVAQDDKALNPDLERFYAKRMGATTTEIKSSHVAFISHPREVTRLIEQAATATAK
jgi:pimeloyl-ACP methyl ester carboxylesterase